jgi:hypothetical protein
MLEHWGGVLEHVERGVYTVRLGPELAEALRREELRLTFNKRLAGKDVELASPGSWLNDQLLQMARSRGRVTLGFLPPREDLDRAHAVGARRRLTIRLEEQVARRYGVLLQFSFRVSFYTQPLQEEVLHVLYDAERNRVLGRSVPPAALQGAPDTDGFEPAPRVNVDRAFRTAWDAVQDAVERRVRTLEEEGRSDHQERLGTVERYYRQLIQEEKRLLKSHTARRAQEETRHKIELLKLEWRRRVKEETERLRPQVVAHLASVAEIRVPLELWRCREVKGGPGRSFWIDLARGESWEDGAVKGKGTR